MEGTVQKPDYQAHLRMLGKYAGVAITLGAFLIGTFTSTPWGVLPQNADAWFWFGMMLLAAFGGKK